MGVDSSSVVQHGLGRLDHLTGVVALKTNDLSRTRSVSRAGAGPVRV